MIFPFPKVGYVSSLAGISIVAEIELYIIYTKLDMHETSQLCRSMPSQKKTPDFNQFQG